MLVIKKLKHVTEAWTCAKLMAGSEPWITLKRDEHTAFGIIRDPLREVYLAVERGEIVGFVIILMKGAFVGYVQSVCVAPEWRGRGIGSQLMTYAESRILSETPNVFLCVSSFNEGARRLYARLGYKVVGELEDYFVAGHSEILLRKTQGPMTEFRRL